MIKDKKKAQNCPLCGSELVEYDNVVLCSGFNYREDKWCRYSDETKEKE